METPGDRKYPSAFELAGSPKPRRDLAAAAPATALLAKIDRSDYNENRIRCSRGSSNPVGNSRRLSDRINASLGGASVGHFLRGFSAEIERVVDPNQEGHAGRAAGALYGGAGRDVRIETGGNLFNLKIAQILNDRCR